MPGPDENAEFADFADEAAPSSDSGESEPTPAPEPASDIDYAGEAPDVDLYAPEVASSESGESTEGFAEDAGDESRVYGYESVAVTRRFDGAGLAAGELAEDSGRTNEADPYALDESAQAAGDGIGYADELAGTSEPDEFTSQVDEGEPGPEYAEESEYSAEGFAPDIDTASSVEDAEAAAEEYAEAPAEDYAGEDGQYEAQGEYEAEPGGEYEAEGQYDDAQGQYEEAPAAEADSEADLAGQAPGAGEAPRRGDTRSLRPGQIPRDVLDDIFDRARKIKDQREA